MVEHTCSRLVWTKWGVASSNINIYDRKSTLLGPGRLSGQLATRHASWQPWSQESSAKTLSQTRLRSALGHKRAKVSVTVARIGFFHTDCLRSWLLCISKIMIVSRWRAVTYKDQRIFPRRSPHNQTKLKNIQ